MAILGPRQVQGHAKAGASFEGFALEAVVEHLGARAHECHFWATHSGAELDLLVARGRRRIGFEFKLGSAPALTRSMHTAVANLDLQQLWVVHAGKERFRMTDRIEALPLRQIGGLEPL